MLRSAGILIDTADFGDLDDASESEVESDSAMEDDNDTSGLRQDFGRRDAESGGVPYPHNVSSVKDLPTSFDSDTSPKLYERRRPTTQKSGPPVYKADRGNSLYYGTSATNYFIPYLKVCC